MVIIRGLWDEIVLSTKKAYITPNFNCVYPSLSLSSHVLYVLVSTEKDAKLRYSIKFATYSQSRLYILPSAACRANDDHTFQAPDSVLPFLALLCSLLYFVVLCNGYWNHTFVVL